MWQTNFTPVLQQMSSLPIYVLHLFLTLTFKLCSVKPNSQSASKVCQLMSRKISSLKIYSAWLFIHFMSLPFFWVEIQLRNMRMSLPLLKCLVSSSYTFRLCALTAIQFTLHFDTVNKQSNSTDNFYMHIPVSKS